MKTKKKFILIAIALLANRVHASVEEHRALAKKHSKEIARQKEITSVLFRKYTNKVIKTLEKKNADLLQQLKKKSDDLAKVSERLEKQKKACQETVRTCKQVDRALKTKEQELGALKQAKKTQSRSLFDFQEKVEDLEKRLKEGKTVSARKVQASIKAKARVQRNKITEQKGQIKGQQKELEELRESSSAKTTKLQSRVKQQREDIVVLQEQQGQQKIDQKATDDKLLVCETRLKKRVEELDIVQFEISRIEKENKALKEINKKLDEENKKIKKQFYLSKQPGQS